MEEVVVVTVACGIELCDAERGTGAVVFVCVFPLSARITTMGFPAMPPPRPFRQTCTVLATKARS